MSGQIVNSRPLKVNNVFHAILSVVNQSIVHLIVEQLAMYVAI